MACAINNQKIDLNLVATFRHVLIDKTDYCVNFDNEKRTLFPLTLIVQLCHSSVLYPYKLCRTYVRCLNCFLARSSFVLHLTWANLLVPFCRYSIMKPSFELYPLFVPTEPKEYGPSEDVHMIFNHLIGAYFIRLIKRGG